MKKNKDSRTRNINNKNSDAVSTRLTNTYNIEVELVEVITNFKEITSP